MLFNSYVFIFGFLPLVLTVFFLIGRYSQKSSAVWLTLSSFTFYAWWSEKYVFLLLISICFNFIISNVISRTLPQSQSQQRYWWLIFAIAFNLIFLGYYKYANFFLHNIGYLTGLPLSSMEIILPLGISFFTFTQIAFLVDTYQGKSSEPSFPHYCLFITYFPHLIAGPVLHHKEMMPQFRELKTYLPSAENFSIGLTIFAIGLFKKVVIADSLSPHANIVFDSALSGYHPTFFEAWAGALAYSLQLYFDFSGYSDMAIGVSRLFNIVLPVNFNSPYRATNIIEFWRSWHITLSRFLRDYLYIPLGGNKLGSIRRYINLLITMVLGGLWHGAGWTYIMWGALHGIYLVINHAWHRLLQHFGANATESTLLGRISGRVITFAAVVVGWVIFRAQSVDSAIFVLKGMAGFNGLLLNFSWQPKLTWVGSLFNQMGLQYGNLIAVDSVNSLGLMLLIVIACSIFPNTQEIVNNSKAIYTARYKCLLFHNIVWSPTYIWGIFIAAIFAISITLIGRESEFLYFQF